MIDIIREDADRVLSALQADFLALQGSSLLLTGATGFVGKGLLSSLIQALETHQLDCRVCLPVRGGAARLKGVIPDNLTKRFDVIDWQPGRLSALGHRHFDFIIHAASPVDIGRYESAPATMMREIVSLTEDVLACASGQSISKFLFISSGAVYGDFFKVVDGPVHESCPAAPALDDWRSCYGEAKRYCELLVASQRYPSALARVFSVTGPWLDLQAPFALAAFIRQASLGNNIVLKSDGSAVRSFCYQSDLTVSLWKLLLTPDMTGAFNVGTEEQASIRSLALKIAEYFPGVRVEFSSRSDSQRNFYVPCLKKMSALYQPQVSLDEGLNRTISSLRQQRRL